MPSGAKEYRPDDDAHPLDLIGIMDKQRMLPKRNVIFSTSCCNLHTKGLILTAYLQLLRSFPRANHEYSVLQILWNPLFKMRSPIRLLIEVNQQHQDPILMLPKHSYVRIYKFISNLGPSA